MPASRHHRPGHSPRLVAATLPFILSEIHGDSPTGNGTEEIVHRYGKPQQLLYFSLHLFDKDDSFEMFPGTGDADDIAGNIVNVHLLPLWKDPLVGLRMKRKSRTSEDSSRCCSRRAWSDRHPTPIHTYIHSRSLLSI